ncbi:MAG: DNA-binding response regulator [Calditrichaeota bacterium]|nr:MAG: DNA-binding response regulator [Calditrichota bacterium]
MIYGGLLALLVLLLRVLEYRYYVRELSIEIYVGLVAILFTALGLWGGTRLFAWGRQPEQALLPTQEPLLDETKLKAYGISNRELEVLQLMAAGLSNQEIADRLFVSLHTVKTHCSNLYAKLGVKRRTQAIRKAREISARS